MIEVCPECDRASFETNHQPDYPDYWCHQCEHRFNTPNKREPKNNGSSTRKGTSKKLLDANPEDWP
jgi:hypothetical protein